MSADVRQTGVDLGGMSRRELVSALARWTVPTVLTLSLGARAAHAAASCPPCTHRVGNVCRACSVSQILNCQCEPCLGAPYCSSGSPTAAYRPTPNASLNGGLSGPAPAGDRAIETYLRRRALSRDQNPLLPGLGGRSGFGARGDTILGGRARSPFGRTPFTPDRRSPAARGLYDRLRTFDERR